MPAIKTISGQSLFDLAVTAYGNVDAAFLILADPAFAAEEVSAALPSGLELPVDPYSPLYKRPALRDLNGATVATLN